MSARLAGLLDGPNDWIITSSEALRGLVSLVEPHLQAVLREQRLIVPHARIHETACALGFTRLVLTGSGDERLLAALQSQA
jgi:uroporphyrinogen-III synthase